MVKGAPLFPFDPPLHWDVDSNLWAFVLASERDLQHEIALQHGFHAAIDKWIRVCEAEITSEKCQIANHLAGNTQ